MPTDHTRDHVTPDLIGRTWLRATNADGGQIAAQGAGAGRQCFGVLRVAREAECALDLRDESVGHITRIRGSKDVSAVLGLCQRSAVCLPPRLEYARCSV